MERRWLLVVRTSHAELFEEDEQASLLFETLRQSNESPAAFGRRVAELVGRAAKQRAFDELEIFASNSILGPLRMCLDEACVSRLVAATNTIDLPPRPTAA